jgi:very-short-patch-repair endonuclease
MRGRTTGRVRGTTPELIAAAKAMRWHPTPAEGRLWEALEGRKLRGLKFRRQHAVGPFILDFYCPAYKLVVELDGAHHAEQASYDQARTEQLMAYGYRVLRFRNHEVLANLDRVLERIARVAGSNATHANARRNAPPRIGGKGGPNDARSK